MKISNKKLHQSDDVLSTNAVEPLVAHRNNLTQKLSRVDPENSPDEWVGIRMELCAVNRQIFSLKEKLSACTECDLRSRCLHVNKKLP